MATTISDQLTSYISDAHSIEEQALAQLRTAPDIAEGARMKQAFRDHLIETEDHERSTRWLLEGRDASTSWFKDFVMKVGGKGFILFARANPDTPGKLLAHAISVRGARGGVVPPARDRRRARRVRRRSPRPPIASEPQETAMRERLEGCFDEGVEESLRALGDVALEEQVAKYLADAHALEEQAIQLLEHASSRDDGSLTAAYAAHLAETRAQVRGRRGAARRARARPLDDEGRPHAHRRDQLERPSSRRTPIRPASSRLRLRVRVPRDRRLRAAEARRDARRRHRDGADFAGRIIGRGAGGGRQASRPAARGGAALAGEKGVAG